MFEIDRANFRTSRGICGGLKKKIQNFTNNVGEK